MNNIFEAASRQKLRFATDRGFVSVEDLWDLSLEHLDKIAHVIDEQIGSQKNSNINRTTVGDKVANLKFSVVISIIETKMIEAEKRKAAADRKAKRDQILELISQKETDAMGRKSVASLRAELDKLDVDEEEVV
jgi:hypothetical protein